MRTIEELQEAIKRQIWHAKYAGMLSEALDELAALRKEVEALREVADSVEHRIKMAGFNQIDQAANGDSIKLDHALLITLIKVREVQDGE